MDDAAAHAADAADVEPMLQRFGRDLGQLREAFAADERRAAEEEACAVATAVAAAAAAAKEARRRALARAKYVGSKAKNKLTARLQYKWPFLRRL